MQDAGRDLGRAAVDREVDEVADRVVAGTGDLDQLLGGGPLGYNAELPEVLRLHADMTTEQTSIRNMSETLTVKDARRRLPELVAAVATTRDHMEITRNGKPVVVLPSHAEFAALQETIAILSDPMAVSDIRQGEADILAARTTEVERLRSTMVSRRPATATR